jgi:hypothetical protein
MGGAKDGQVVEVDGTRLPYVYLVPETPPMTALCLPEADPIPGRRLEFTEIEYVRALWVAPGWEPPERRARVVYVERGLLDRLMQRG